jgi:hypothetical protein
MPDVESPEEAEAVLKRWQDDYFFPTATLVLQELENIKQEFQDKAGPLEDTDSECSDDGDNDPDYELDVVGKSLLLLRGCTRKVSSSMQ